MNVFFFFYLQIFLFKKWLTLLYIKYYLGELFYTEPFKYKNRKTKIIKREQLEIIVN